MKKLKIAVLISGRGSNLQAVIDACKTPIFPVEIVLVISNNPDAKGLARAYKAKIPSKVINHKDFSSRAEFDNALHESVSASGAELICLAGFMRLLTADFINKWPNKIINIHPSLLPVFKGTNAHEQAIAAGVRITGCTVHFVVPEMDSGPIILQAALPIHQKDTAETLGAKVLKLEHRCYPIAIHWIAEDKVKVEGNRVILEKKLADIVAPESPY